MWVFLPNNLSWIKCDEPPLPARSMHAACLWKSISGNQRIVIFGGTGRNGACSDLWSFKLAASLNTDLGAT